MKLCVWVNLEKMRFIDCNDRYTGNLRRKIDIVNLFGPCEMSQGWDGPLIYDIAKVSPANLGPGPVDEARFLAINFLETRACVG